MTISVRLDQPAFNRHRLNAEKLIAFNKLEQLSASNWTRVALIAAATMLWIAAAATGPAHAQQPVQDAAQSQPANVDPARLKSAYEFQKAAKFDEQLSTMVPLLTRQILGMMMPIFEQEIQDDRRKAELAAFSQQLSAEIEKLFTARQGEFRDLMAVIYARVLTTEQLDALTEFYRSEAGQKFVTASPEMMAEMAPMVMAMMSGKPIEIDRGVDPAPLAAAREMLKASKSERMLDAVMGQATGGSLAPPAAAGNAKPNGGPAEKMFDMLANLENRRGEMLDAVAVRWAKRFTVEEMQAVTAFYRTPHGEAVVDAMPALLTEQQKVTASFFQTMSVDLGKSLTQMLPKQ